MNLKLEAASSTPPKGLRDLLLDIGDGEDGFTGTPVHGGEASVEDFLQQCCDMARGINLPPGRVPQTVFWLLDEDSVAVGMIRIRTVLNDQLQLRGGHVGYYIRTDRRRRGYAKQALRLAVAELRRSGVNRILVTVYPENTPSIKAVLANGGTYQDTTTIPETGALVNRYWIEWQA